MPRAKKEANKDPQRPRLVVGIGASAGGLDACKRLLGEMPRESGLSLIVVMHLDPTHQSHIAEILKTSTEMEVVQAADEQTLAPNCVYVIAPDRYLEVRHGVLYSEGPRKPHGERKPVDTLLSSLAEDQKERAVGVILSGAGNNGSNGIRDVKEHGGLCLAQAPQTAQYDSMPQNAIDTGVIDHVLPPEEIPRILLQYANDPEAARAPAQKTREEKKEIQKAEHPDAFDRILDLLHRAYGVNFRGSYKKGTLLRRTERRIDLKHLSGWQPYLEILERDPGEVAALYRDLLIGVTEFFRDPEVWDYLAAEVVPGLLARKDEERTMPFKIWVPGCATGEEPYSLAILFLEEMERSRRSTKLQIFASDVAEEALAFARRGLYPASIQKTVSPERLSRFFRREGEGFEVTREVREAVTFATHNLLADPPFSRLDMVSCRNVLIYLEALAQQRIFEVFHFALKPGGLLLLGASETVGQHGDLFEPVSKKARVYRSTAISEGARHHRVDWYAERAPFRGSPEAHPPPPRGQRVNRAIEQIVLSRYVWACVVVTRSFEIQSFFGPTQDYLIQPTGELRMDVLSWAKPGLFPRLRTALERAVEHGERVHVTDMRIDRDGESQRVECVIEPIRPLPGEAPLFLIAFRDVPRPPTVEVSEADKTEESLVRQLEAELKNSREELQSTIEQLNSTNEEYRASHEELLSLNEELQSNNEELEASKEELQSLNEEMVTINRQLEDKNVELRTANADLNNLLLSTKIPLLFLDRSLRVRRFTPAATELMHLVPSDRGRSVEHIKERFSGEDLVADARSVLEKLTPITRELETEDGRFYERTVLPYRTEEDRIDGVCVAFYNITERRKVAQVIEEARDYAEAIVDTVRTPLLVLDKDIRVVSANESFYETFRVSRSQTQGSRLYDLGNRQWNIPALRNLLDEILPENKEVKGYEVEHHFEHIGLRVMYLNARLMSRKERPPLILLAIEDVTERAEAARVIKERADELIREHQRKDEFLAMLGHELRNPLAALLHGLDILRLARDDAAQQERTREMMTRQAKRIGSILDQLLDISRLNAGKDQMARAPVDLAETVQGAVEAVTPLVDAHKHTLRVSAPTDGKVMVEGDLARLTQVVENLLSNAAKYTKDGGQIDLSLEEDRDWARIRVRDTGIGMDPDLLPRIFDLFTQAPRTLDRSEGGMGLGLSLVKRVVELHGGRVEASSPGRGQGSELVVTLPRLRERARARSEEASRGSPDKAKPRRVLVVDDEEDVSETLAELLNMQGHEARAVLDGAAALKAVKELSPDVVLLDLGLPAMDGYEVAKRLRKEQGDKEILLVALTGYQKDAERLREAGFDWHMIKPPDIEKLLEWLARKGEPRKSPE